MRNRDLVALFDYGYWADRRLLEAAARLTPEQWTAREQITTRDLRDTLVHALDVEWSWRLRLQKRPTEAWGPEAELRPADYPTAADLAEHWARDEAEMRTWLATLDDNALARDIDIGDKHRFPLWYYLVHIATHSQQQRADAATLLTRFGCSPGNLDFLDYADSITETPPTRP